MRNRNKRDKRKASFGQAWFLPRVARLVSTIMRAISSWVPAIAQSLTQMSASINAFRAGFELPAPITDEHKELEL